MSELTLRSRSLYRSAAALSVLIRLSTTWGPYGAFYVLIGAVEPIFHLETLADTLDDSHAEKKLYLFLVGLARAQLHFINRLDTGTNTTEELALIFSRKTLEILDSIRCVPRSYNRYSLTDYASPPSHSSFESVVDACSLFAESASTLNDLLERHCRFTPAAHSVVGTTYTLFIFLVNFLANQYQTNHQLQKLVLSTLSRWLEGVMVAILRFRHHLHLTWILPVCELYNMCIA